MAELPKSRRIYSAYLAAAFTGTAGEAHTDHLPAALWVPPGDIRIIGVDLYSKINFLPDADLAKASCYCYASIGMLPQIGGVNELVIAFSELYPVELPTIGEHFLAGVRMQYSHNMFPDPLGFATNEWHPVYLNVSHRNLWAENVEVAGQGHVFYVEM